MHEQQYPICRGCGCRARLVGGLAVVQYSSVGAAAAAVAAASCWWVGLCRLRFGMHQLSQSIQCLGWQSGFGIGAQLLRRLSERCESVLVWFTAAAASVMIEQGVGSCLQLLLALCSCKSCVVVRPNMQLSSPVYRHQGLAHRHCAVVTDSDRWTGPYIVCMSCDSVLISAVCMLGCMSIV